MRQKCYLVCHNLGLAVEHDSWGGTAVEAVLSLAWVGQISKQQCHGLSRRQNGLRDVSHTSSDAQKDDSYTGRERVERGRRDLRLRRCDRVAVEQKFNTDWSGENAEFGYWLISLARRVNCTQLCCCSISMFSGILKWYLSLHRRLH